MGSTRIEYRMLPGTRAAVGYSGSHSVVADRPAGTAGGLGLGFNGGELLALAVGGCFCNDVQSIADEMGVAVADLEISVTIDFSGEPSRATDVRMVVRCVLSDGSDATDLIGRAKARTTIGNSIRDGIPFAVKSRHG